MNLRLRALAWFGLSFGFLGIVSCGNPSVVDDAHHPIVGTWLVKDPNAPFPYHLYVFNSDGTVHQANPDAGDARTSDSDGKGAWKRDGSRVVGKWVELQADRATHRYAGRLELSFVIEVHGDTLSGTETAHTFDAEGTASGDIPTPARITGQRISAL